MSERLTDGQLAEWREYSVAGAAHLARIYPPAEMLAVLDELIALRAEADTLAKQCAVLRRENIALRAEAAKLRAVAEAAKAMVQRPGIVSMQDFEALAGAVAAMEASDD